MAFVVIVAGVLAILAVSAITPEVTAQCSAGQFAYNETAKGGFGCSPVVTALESLTGSLTLNPSGSDISISGSTITMEPRWWAATHGLVGYWNMNEAQGTSSFDGSGDGNIGTLTNGPTWIQGRFGSGLSFASASSQYVAIANAASLTLSASWTVCAWFKTSSANGVIVNKGTGVGNANYYLYINGGNLVAGVHNAAFDSVTSGGTYNDGNWHFACGEWDDAAGTLYIYADGSLASSGTFTGHPTTDTSPVGIGQTTTGLGYFNGQIDDARIFNVALSATEIDGLLYLYVPGA